MYVCTYKLVICGGIHLILMNAIRSTLTALLSKGTDALLRAIASDLMALV